MISSEKNFFPDELNPVHSQTIEARKITSLRILITRRSETFEERKSNEILSRFLVDTPTFPTVKDEFL